MNPTPFEVVPAEESDKAPYEELADMKWHDRNLKVLIAIGGWKFNEPWMATDSSMSIVTR
jgi:GH18 family chitinase